jgi:serine/threonine protein kinase
MNDDGSTESKGSESLPELIQSDIFATGTILYKMILGFDPVMKEDSVVPHKPFKSLPVEIKNLLSRFLSRKDIVRFQSMKQVLGVIEKIHSEDEDFDKTVVSLDDALSNTALKTRENRIKTMKRRFVAAAIVLVLVGILAIGFALI